MPQIIAISKIDFPYKISQQEVKNYASNLFAPSFPEVNRMMSIFDNTEIKERNFCKPLNYYAASKGFEQNNNEFVQCAVDYSAKAVEECVMKAGINKEDITDIVFVSSTGLATPSLDALLINRLKLNVNINRLPIFGLGCAGGVAGLAKANTIAKANEDALVLLVCVELCSLTFLKNDYSKSNFVASSLFSDGAAACIIKGDKQINKTKKQISFFASQSKLYYNSLDVMGWQFTDMGFKVLFSSDIPSIIGKNVKHDINSFLFKYQLTLKDIKSFIFHPGGKKVLEAYKDALQMDGDFLKNTREVMNSYGNMSSVTVLYVMDKFLTDGFDDGYGLLLALGPGFSSEMALLEMDNN